ncbi:MAG: hypothetical protein F2840_01245 [Actinobacteria bacterium]|jgi:hypothetical protein|uniref:Unannotated protein n=1 Tax=freshwater metagenome TaxID=449393 RepID=A0A6J7IIE7_9ZZZZ|nr:hypothetical protein [Actinomycetota bacterium]
MTRFVPPGWPRGLPPGGTPEFDERVVGWLLDQGPADLRTSELRHLPLALATYLEHHIDGCLEGARRAYGQARTDLGSAMPADELARAQRALESEGARLLQVQREVRLVLVAMRVPPPDTGGRMGR